MDVTADDLDEVVAIGYGSVTKNSLGIKISSECFKQKSLMLKNRLNSLKKSGARYIVPVAEHHDAFAMYNSKFTKWNSVNMESKKDILGELAMEVRNLEIKFMYHIPFMKLRCITPCVL